MNYVAPRIVGLSLNECQNPSIDAYADSAIGWSFSTGFPFNVGVGFGGTIGGGGGCSCQCQCQCQCQGQ
jgi:hypothetical protein